MVKRFIGLWRRTHEEATLDADGNQPGMQLFRRIGYPAVTWAKVGDAELPPLILIGINPRESGVLNPGSKIGLPLMVEPVSLKLV